MYVNKESQTVTINNIAFLCNVLWSHPGLMELLDAPAYLRAYFSSSSVVPKTKKLFSR